MSRKTLVVVGVLVLAVIVAGVAIFAQTRPQQAMTDGPGIVYFFSPT
ncbi:MAG: hypothetical protein GY832_08100 [Chloroflexi bacterium]|nr:hypothetical protein [Chloroflexota bacterium]